MKNSNLPIITGGTYSKPRQGILETRYSAEESKKMMSLSQMKLLNYSLMSIKPENNEFKFTLNCKEYCEIHGIDATGGKNVNDLRKTVKYFHTSPTQHMVIDEKSDRYVRVSAIWFPRIKEIGKKSDNTILGYEITVDQDIAKAMAGDPDQKKFPYVCAAKLQSTYGLLTWEYFHDLDIFNHPFTLTLEEFAEKIGAMHYLGDNYKWSNFKTKILDTVTNDINENSLDMVISWEPEKDTTTEVGRKKVVGIEFTVRRVIDPINLREVCVSDDLDAELLEAIKARVNFEHLCTLPESREKAELAVRVVYAAIMAVKLNNEYFAIKFNMTNDQMLSALNSVTADHIHQGILKAYGKKSHIRQNEVYLLNCILNAAITPAVPQIEAENEELHNLDLFTSFAIAPGQCEIEVIEDPSVTTRKEKEPKFRRATKAEMTEARKEIEELVVPGLLERYLTPLNCESEMLAFIQMCVNDFYEALVGVFSTKTPVYDMGKPSGVLLTEHIRIEFRGNLSQDKAEKAMQKYIANYENLRCRDNPSSRRKYIIRTLWNGLYENSNNEDYTDF